MILTDLLILSSLSLLYPLHSYYKKEDKTDEFEKWIAILLLTVVITSVIHWSNPIRYTLIHKLDMFLTKFLLILLPLYIFYYKKNVTSKDKELSIVLCILGLIFYNISNKYSSENYQTTNHVIPHVAFHIISAIGAKLAFK